MLKEKFNIGLISDELTRKSLEVKNNIHNITPKNYKKVLKNKIDFVFIESSWNGYNNSWKYKIAKYEKKYNNNNLVGKFLNFLYPRNNQKFIDFINYCKKKNIKTVFWNKEDSVHFDRFIDSAKYCDYIFTVDSNCVKKYKRYAKGKYVDVLTFMIEPTLCNNKKSNQKINKINFLGSYSKHIHHKRRELQDNFFKLCEKYNIKVDVYDRNSNRKSDNYRFPKKYKNLKIFPAIKYEKTSQIYENYIASFNVNTIDNSETFFSRRLLEIIASGNVAITNWTPSVEKYFKDYCIYFKSNNELEDIIKTISTNGISDQAISNAIQGSRYIMQNHTWSIGLNYIYKIINKDLL